MSARAGRRPRCAMYLATVDPETTCPSRCSSAWILVAPQVMFSSDMRRIRRITLIRIDSRPGAAPHFHRRSTGIHARCQRMTVCGLTMTTASDHLRQKRDNTTQTKRSCGRSAGLLIVLRYTASCRRRARSSRARYVRSRRNPRQARERENTRCIEVSSLAQVAA